MSTSAVSSSTRGAYVTASSSTGVMRLIQDLKTQTDDCDWPKASQTAQQLVGSGRAIILQNIQHSKNFNPLPMTETLLATLSSSQLQWEDDTKYHLARAARLFIELACMKAVTENLPVYQETQTALREQLDKLIEYARDDQVALKYELKCCSEALRLMEKIDMKGYVTALVEAVQNPSMGSIVSLLKLVPDILSKRRQAWFTEALFLNWFTLPARTDSKLFNELRGTLKTHLNTLEIAQTGVEFLADVVWNGTSELQQEALSGEPGLITLLNKLRPSRSLLDLVRTMGPVRYRAVQVLSTLTSHANPRIAQQATRALLDRRLQESDPKVKELLTALEKNPQISRAWKTQFEECKSQIIDQNIEEAAAIEEQEQRLKDLEYQLQEATRLKKGSQEQLAKQKKELNAERKYIEELRAENSAHKENVESLHLLYKKGVNILLDDIFNQPQHASDDAPSHSCCPITGVEMEDPVIAEDGNSYERDAIEKWFMDHDTSPLTHCRLKSKILIPNRQLKEAIEHAKGSSTQRRSSSSFQSSSSTPSDKTDYSKLLIRLLDHEEVQKMEALTKILDDLFEELRKHKTPELTPAQKESYALVQELLVDQKVSSYVSRKLLQMHVPAFPQTVAIASTPSKAPVAVPSIAFGAADWKKYFGDVGVVPPLPSNIEAILDAPCPFWPGKKVRETHLLFYKPETVNGQPLSLASLGELVQKPLQGNATKYDWLHTGEYKSNTPSDKAYWFLMTRDVIPESRNKSYADQQKLVATCSQKAKIAYEVPHILDACLAIFSEKVCSGTHLYGREPWTYTCCQEKYKADCQLVVGGFAPGGLRVSFSHFGYDDGGVGVQRKF